MKKRKLFVCIAIILVSACLLCFAQALFLPKYMTSTKEGALIREYYEDSSDHDVLFLGDCEVYEGITPPTLWEEYGITSYVRGSAQQLIWQSYYLLEDTLRYETPKVVVYNVLAMKYGEPQNEAYNRMTLDGMKWSWSKVNAIRASMTEEESFLSYVFPLLRYHSRWSDLSGEDFEYLCKRDTVSHNGYLMQTGVVPKTDEEPGMELLDYTLPQISFDYLTRMKNLCEENGIRLILVKSPTDSWRYYWYDEWDEQISDYAEKNGLDYWNFIPLWEEIGIDWSTDSYDGGVHLNVYGAEKWTAYFGKILSERYEIPDRRGDADLSSLWQEKIEKFRVEKGEIR